MELLDNGLLGAAMTNFFSSLEGDSGGAAYSVQMDDEDSASFDLSDFILLNDNALPPAPQEFSAAAPVAMARSFEGSFAPPTIVENNTRDELPPLPRMEEGSRIAFRIKTDEEILDDGFKWRKYGKKSVKNSPNPRNYYRCSTEGCSVKKRVERDHEDPCYVITTYEGIHNHSSPGVVYYATQDSVSGRFLFSGSHVHGPGPGSSATGSSTSNLT